MYMYVCITYLQSLAPTNLHWACVVGYGPLSLSVIHKKSLCPSIGDINKLIIVIDKRLTVIFFTIKELVILFRHRKMALQLTQDRLDTE
jgi:hypothetical protein